MALVALFCGSSGFIAICKFSLRAFSLGGRFKFPKTERPAIREGMTGLRESMGQNG